MNNYERLLKKREVAQGKYIDANYGFKKYSYETLKDITKQLLKIEVNQSKRRAKNACISQKH